MRKSLVTVIVFVVLSLVPAGRADAALSAEKIQSLFSQANEAFRQANSATDNAEQQRLYEKAILLFERLIDEGQTRNPRLYYNLANAYFLKEDIGRAILNYRRAEKLDSTDANLQKNLAFARSRRIDKVKVKTQQRVLKTLLFWHYDFSIRTRFLLSCIFFAGVCICLTVRIWFGRNAAAKTGAVIFGVLVVCCLGSVVYEAASQRRAICGVITAEQVIARQGDGQNYGPSFKAPLHAGTEFDVLETRPGWYHIELADGSDGWIAQQSAELI